MNSLVRAHPAEEHGITAVTATDREVAGVETVVNHARHAYVGCLRGLVMRDGDDRSPPPHRPVHVTQVALERPVVGCHHRQPREPLGVERANQGVVVNNVEIGDRVIRVDDVPQFGGRPAVTDPDGLVEDPRLGDRAGAVAGGEQQDLVTGGVQPAGQPIEHRLCPSVRQRGHGNPRWSDDGDAQVARLGISPRDRTGIGIGPDLPGRRRTECRTPLRLASLYPLAPPLSSSGSRVPRPWSMGRDRVRPASPAMVAASRAASAPDTALRWRGSSLSSRS